MVMYKCSILADPEGKAWDFAYSIYENLRKKSDKFEMNEVRVKRFRDGEIKVKIKENIRRKNCFFIHDSSKQPAEWLMELIFVNEAMKNSSANEIINVLPYTKFSRQDRKDESRVAVNAKALADVICLYANRVLTVDAHFTQIQGFYRIPLDNLYSSNVLLDYLKAKHKDFLGNIVVMSPDAGGASRAKAFATKLGIKDIVIGYKYRKSEGEVNEFKIIGEVAGKNVLIVDDIVDSGNTLIEAARKLREEGAKKVYAYCTHGVFSKNAREKISKELDLMIVSNSIPQPKHEKIEVVPLNDFFTEAIYRTSEGFSLSELFE
jgi:ribose-phosphate pyrophosphokinase